MRAYRAVAAGADLPSAAVTRYGVTQGEVETVEYLPREDEVDAAIALVRRNGAAGSGLLRLPYDRRGGYTSINGYCRPSCNRTNWNRIKRFGHHLLQFAFDVDR